MVAYAIGVAACVVEAWAEHCPEGFDADHISWVVEGREWEGFGGYLIEINFQLPLKREYM